MLGRKVILEKAHSDLDNDFFAERFDSFLTSIESDSIIEQIQEAFKNLKPAKEYQREIAEIISALEIAPYTNVDATNIEAIFLFMTFSLLSKTKK